MNWNNTLPELNNKKVKTDWFPTSLRKTINALVISTSLVLSGCTSDLEWSERTAEYYNIDNFKLALEQKLFSNKIEIFYPHEAEEEMRKILEIAKIIDLVTKIWEEADKEWITKFWDYLIIRENWKVSVWYIWNDWNMFITDLETLKESAEEQLIAIEKAIS